MTAPLYKLSINQDQITRRDLPLRDASDYGMTTSLNEWLKHLSPHNDGGRDAYYKPKDPFNIKPPDIT